MDMYIVLAIAAMLGYGVTSAIYKMAGKDIDPVSLTFITSIIMTLTIFIFWLFIKQKHITLKGFEYATIAGVIAGFSFIAFIVSINIGRVTIASTLRGLSFLITAAIAILFLSEKITFAQAAGIALAAISIILLTI